MRGMMQFGRRLVRSTVIAAAAALAVGGVRRARQKSYSEAPDFTAVPRPSGGGPRGFVATIEDTSNDRGFVASVEDRSNDRGFRQGEPVRVPEAGLPPSGQAATDEPSAADRVPGEEADASPGG